MVLAPLSLVLVVVLVLVLEPKKGARSGAKLHQEKLDICQLGVRFVSRATDLIVEGCDSP